MTTHCECRHRCTRTDGRSRRHWSRRTRHLAPCRCRGSGGHTPHRSDVVSVAAVGREDAHGGPAARAHGDADAVASRDVESLIRLRSGCVHVGLGGVSVLGDRPAVGLTRQESSETVRSRAVPSVIAPRSTRRRSVSTSRCNRQSGRRRRPFLPVAGTISM